MLFHQTRPIRVAASVAAIVGLMAASASVAQAAQPTLSLTNSVATVGIAPAATVGFTPAAPGANGVALPASAEPSFVSASRAVAQNVIAQEDAARAAAEAATAAAAAAEAAASWQLPVSSYNLTARFGQKGPWARGWHTGLDFAGPSGQDVRAAKSGRVTEAGYQGAYGNTLVIDHGDGYSTRYAHLQSAPRVSVGESVSGGQVIGYLGNTGNSSGPHLHFEVLRGGEFVNPASVFDIPSSN